MASTSHENQPPTARAELNVTINVAPSNRASCQYCKEPITQGANRVSFPSRKGNITVAKHLHPKCFAEYCVAVDYAPSGRAKCKDTQTEIVKGQARCLLRLISCEGTPKDQRIYSPTAPFVVDFLKELLALEEVQGVVSVDSISQRLADNNAPAEHKRWLADALSGASVAGRPLPIKEEAPKEAKPKKQPKKKKAEEEVVEGDEVGGAPSKAKKRKHKEEEVATKAPAVDDEEDGELVE